MTRADLSAENSIIGAALIDDRCLPAVMEAVAVSDFEAGMAREVFGAIERLYAAGKTIDPITVLSELGDGREYRAYIQAVMDVTPTAANVGEYCRILKAQARERELARIADEIHDGLLIGGGWRELATKAHEALERLDGNSDTAETSTNVMVRWAQHYMAVKTDPDKAYCKTGYRALDHALGGGMFRGEVYILAGRPGMGKTTQGVEIAERIAATGRPVLFASLEMSELQLAAKRIAGAAGISYTEAVSGRLGAEEEKIAMQTAMRLSERPFYIAESAATVEDIEAGARGIAGLAVIVVDYLGLIGTGEKPAPRYEEMTRISAALKSLAKRLNVPVLALAQLNRENTTRTEKRPILSDLRDSGAIEQDAGGVILLHRESYYKPDEDPPEREPIELIIAKNRHAAPRTITMEWCGRTGQISEYYDGDTPWD